MREGLRIGLFVLVGCASESSQPDAMSTPVTLRILVSDSEPPERPRPGPEPAVFIDDVLTTDLELLHATQIEALDELHTIELRLGEAVIASRQFELGVEARQCVDRAGTIRRATIAFCGYASGDLRFASHTIEGDRTCIGDGFCQPACAPLAPNACGAEQRCTSVITSIAPLASRAGCAPIGPKQLGDACALLETSEGRYDDCGEYLLCVEGSCRLLCDGPDALYVPGHAPELRICP